MASKKWAEKKFDVKIAKAEIKVGQLRGWCNHQKEKNQECFQGEQLEHEKINGTLIFRNLDTIYEKNIFPFCHL